MTLAMQSPKSTLEDILDTRIVTPEQVLALRFEIWRDARLSRAEAEVLFEVHDTLECGCGEWDDFFCEALIAHLVEGAHPEGYVGDDDAAWFGARVRREGAPVSPVALEAVVQLLERATDVPASLSGLALEAIRDGILSPDVQLFADGPVGTGIIGDPEAALLRRAFYAKASPRSEAISRAEAEILLELDRATVGRGNASAWTVLFVNALSNCLLVASGYEPPSRQRMAEVDRWLNAPGPGIGGFLQRMVDRDGARLPRETLRATLTGQTPMATHYRRRLDTAASGQADAARVDADEAAWLCAHLSDDAAWTPAMKALFAFLDAGGYDLDPSLRGFSARAK